ncbi:hypothetical protein JW933_09885 [candidate division FCPU426 bacterium]|nr:hypothetical protein [candidate division FCPU426 bacterium]
MTMQPGARRQRKEKQAGQTGKLSTGRVFTAACLLLGAIGGLAACASMQHPIHYTVTKPGKIDFADIHTLAVLDFGNPLGQPHWGAAMAQALAAVINETGAARVLSSGPTRQAFQRLRVTRSRFQEKRVIQQLGQDLNARGLLFGDITAAEIRPFIATEMVIRQQGFRQEEELAVDARGNTRVIIRSVPVYIQIKRENITRQVRVQAEARLVRTGDGAVLWQGQTELLQEYASVRENGRCLEGVCLADEELMALAFQAFGRKLLQELLPQQLVRQRYLAQAVTDDEYAELINKGNMAARSNDWNSAGIFWLRAQALHPGRPEAHANLGLLREKTGDYTQAVKDFTYAAKQLGPSWRRNLAELKKMLGL